MCRSSSAGEVSVCHGMGTGISTVREREERNDHFSNVGGVTR